MDKQKKILIIDKSQCFISEVENFFSQNNVSVISTGSGLDGIKLVYQQQPILVITDSITDSINGFDFAKLIKAESKLKNTYIVIYSSVASTKNHFYADISRADLFFNKKDIEPENLMLLCSNVIENSDFIPSNNIKDIPSIDEITVQLDSMYNNFQMKDILNDSIFNLLSTVDSLDSLIDSFFLFMNKFFNIEAAALLLDNRNGFSYFFKSSPSISTDHKNNIFNEVKTHFSEKNNIKKLPERDFYIRNFLNFPENINNSKGKPGANLFTFYYRNRYIILYIGHTFTTGDEYLYLNYAVSQFDKMLKQVWTYHDEVAYSQSIRFSFSKFIPEKIIDDLMRKKTDEDLMIGEKRNIAVLFSHIKNFNEIEQNNSAEDTVNFLNNHFSIFSNCIKEEGGTINKYINDAIFAMFGAPESYENNVERCLRASIAVLKILRDPEKQKLFPNVKYYKIGIGIHYGDVIIGNIGSRDSFDYTGIGDNINLAARLESLNKFYNTDILISEDVKLNAEKYNLNVFFREIDTIKVKGRAAATTVYSVEAEDFFTDNFISHYMKGIKMFRLGNWNLALEFFKNAAAIYDDDRVTEIYLDRCKKFIKTPPENWDGALKLDFK